MAKKTEKTPLKKEGKKITAKKKVLKKEVIDKKPKKSSQPVAIKIKRETTPIIESEVSQAVQNDIPVSAEKQPTIINKEITKDERITVHKVEPLQSDHARAVIMWTCVFSFMAVILIIWAYNFKIIMDSEKVVSESTTNDQLRQLSEQVRDNLSQFKKDIAEIKSIASSTTGSRADLFQAASSTDMTASSTQASGSATTTSNQIDQLKKTLEKKSSGKPALE